MTGRYPTRRDGKMSARLRRWLPVFAVVGAVFLLAAAVYVPVRLTSTTSYCTSCHAMEAAGASLKRSPHRNLDCLSCHVDPGVGNAIAWRLQESKNIWATYLNMPVTKGMSKQVHVPSKAACTRSGCHDLSSLGTTFGNVKMNHARHVRDARADLHRLPQDRRPLRDAARRPPSPWPPASCATTAPRRPTSAASAT